MTTDIHYLYIRHVLNWHGGSLILTMDINLIKVMDVDDRQAGQISDRLFFWYCRHHTLKTNAY